MKKGTYYLTRQRQKEKRQQREDAITPADPFEGKNMIDISSVDDMYSGYRLYQDLDTGQIYRQHITGGPITNKTTGEVIYEPKER